MKLFYNNYVFNVFFVLIQYSAFWQQRPCITRYIFGTGTQYLLQLIPGDLLSACPHRQFHTLPGLLVSRAALSKPNPNTCVECRKAVCTIFMVVFGITLWGREPTTYQIYPRKWGRKVCFHQLSHLHTIVRELAEIYIACRVQKVWLFKTYKGPIWTPKWPVLSYEFGAFRQGRCLKRA